MATPLYQLVMHSGPTPEKAFELTRQVISIGRDYSNELVINDPEISRKHARLTAQSGSYILEDMGSTNGTFVNGQRLLGPHLLRPGELITFGENVSLSFDALQFDPNATVVSPVDLPLYQSPASQFDAPTPFAPAPVSGIPSEAAVRQPPAANVSPLAPVYTPTPLQPPAYSGQIPQSPETDATPQKGSRSWIWLGIGCLAVFVCVCAGSAFAFDSLNLYCLPPFNSLFDWLYTCP